MTEPNYKDFAEWVIRTGCWDSSMGLDGLEIQDKALEYGIIEEVDYDPEVHGPNDVDADAGDSWFIFVLPTSAVSPTAQPESQAAPTGR